MKNWSTDIKILKKHPEQYKIWKLEQCINFGLDGKKISAKELKQYWPKLKIDPARRRFLNMLLND